MVGFKVNRRLIGWLGQWNGFGRAKRDLTHLLIDPFISILRFPLAPASANGSHKLSKFDAARTLKAACFFFTSQRVRVSRRFTVIKLRNEFCSPFHTQSHNAGQIHVRKRTIQGDEQRD